MSPQREEIEPVRRQRGGIGRDHNTLPVADPARHRRYVGVAAGELLRRIAYRRHGGAHASPPTWASTSARTSGQSYIGKAAMNALMAPYAGRTLLVASRSLLRRLGWHRHGAPAMDGTAAHPWTERAARFRLAPEHGVCHRFLGAEGMVPEQRQIARIGVARVHFSHSSRRALNSAGRSYQAALGSFVVDQMEIVVEKQQRERRMLHDDRAPVRPFRPLVLRQRCGWRSTTGRARPAPAHKARAVSRTGTR